MPQNLEVELRDKNGDLKKSLAASCLPGWEYLRTGGCGQAELIIPAPVAGVVDRLLAPQDELRISIGNQVRYSGKLLKIRRTIKGGEEMLALTFYGYLTELSEAIINATYENMEVSAIVKAILDAKIVGQKRVTYTASEIEETDFSVTSVVLNQTVLDAISFLGSLAGDFEWGVDRNKKFYFKRRDTVVRRTYSIGREIMDYTEIEDHEAVKNSVFIYGAEDRVTPLATLSAGGSVAVFGAREFNVFNSSISEASDGNRLGLVNVKNLEGRSRQMQVAMKQDDYFVEETHPIGATAILMEPITVPQKYGNNFKYGRNQKYGSLKRDQIATIKYTLAGGGFLIGLTLNQEVPNSGDQQRQVEKQVQDLQLR